jgi:hypothetical protein
VLYDVVTAILVRSPNLNYDFKAMKGVCDFHIDLTDTVRSCEYVARWDLEFIFMFVVVLSFSAVDVYFPPFPSCDVPSILLVQRTHVCIYRVHDVHSTHMLVPSPEQDKTCPFNSSDCLGRARLQSSTRTVCLALLGREKATRSFALHDNDPDFLAMRF